MIKAILISAMLICSIANAQEKKERPPVNWKPVVGMVLEGGKIYVDANSITIVDTSHSRRFTTADLMVSFDVPTIAMSDKKALMFRSKVHTLVIECESGNAAPVADLYFKELMPDRSARPLGGEVYSKDPTHTIYKMDKKSAIYNTLCPNFI